MDFQKEVIESPLPVVVDFWAEWCGPCKMLAPVLEQLSLDFAGKANIVKVNIDTFPELSKQYKITGIPTLLFFKGGQVTDTVVGMTSKKNITDKLTKLV